MISFTTSGSFKNTEDFLRKAARFDVRSALEAGGKAGVAALAAATPVETGLASHSWTYEISGGSGSYTITWMNTDVEGGFQVALAIQFGHGTGTGGYVPGRDYINPAMRPIFDKIEADVWKAVTSA